MANEQWHLSKSVPISFILAIIGQTIALVWFVASMNNSIDTNARDLVRHETRITSLEQIVQSQAITLARIDANISSIKEHLERSRP